MKDSVEDCMEFFRKGFPESGPKNFRTQVGVHLEELHEMIQTLEPEKQEDKLLLVFLGRAISDAAEHFKNNDGIINIKDRVEFLDSICDQMVTAVGLGHHADMNVVDAFKEVNRSNHSKFDDNGQPILDKNLKLIKGPNYSKPDLKSFV